MSERIEDSNSRDPASEVQPLPEAVAQPAEYLYILCRCGKRLTLKSQNPKQPGLGPYQGYCRRPCAVEYIVQVNLLG